VTGRPIEPPWAAIVLAGGAARRLGGVDKPALVVGGRSLLDTAVVACSDAGAERVVVAGPTRPTERPVVWTREQPAGGGPLAALAAGLAVVPPACTTVVVLAADLPTVSTALVTGLVELARAEGGPDDARSGSAPDGAVVIDKEGTLQTLVAAYSRTALARALAAVGDPHNRPVRALLSHLDLRVLPDDTVADIDTPADAARWLGHAGRTTEGGRA
jgi:molybdopterin-guanine dinucleotide biosynthesis protein A